MHVLGGVVTAQAGAASVVWEGFEPPASATKDGVLPLNYHTHPYSRDGIASPDLHSRGKPGAELAGVNGG